MRPLRELLSDPAISTYREQVMEQVFCAELIQAAWRRGLSPLEIDRPFVDFKGYDLVITCSTLTRHVQLKTVFPASKTGHVPVQLALMEKRSGCVVLMMVDLDSNDHLSLQYRFLGEASGDPLQLSPALKITKRSTPNSLGKRVDRLAHRDVPFRRHPRNPEDGFGPVQTIDELCDVFLGAARSSPNGTGLLKKL